MVRTALVTGAAGFIGYHCCQALLAAGYRVTGLDALTPATDPGLKQARLTRLHAHPQFHPVIDRVERPGTLAALWPAQGFDLVLHLASEVGLRGSIDAPRAHLHTNIGGTLEVLEAARHHGTQHLMLASTAATYGLSPHLPCHERQCSDHPISTYGATKKAAEALTHAYAHLFRIPVTVLRFFTVYGPWGRPDMALFSFVRAILQDDPIPLHNYGQMQRDFIYAPDLADNMIRLARVIPGDTPACDTDSLSPVAPWRLVNLGSTTPVSLDRFITAIETALNRPARRQPVPRKPGEAIETWADTTLVQNLISPPAPTRIEDGVAQAIDWYGRYYQRDPPRVA